MPARPPSSSDRFICLVAWFNLHVRNQPVSLPIRQMSLNIPRDLFFPGEVFGRHRGEPSSRVSFPLLEVFSVHPLDCVKTLLKDVVRAWMNFIFFPKTKAVAIHPIFVTIITSDLFDGYAELIIEHRMKNTAAAKRAGLRFFHFFIRDPVQDLYVVTLVLMVGYEASDSVPFL